MERLMIYRGLRPAGELLVWEEPLYVRFEASCAWEEGVWRLWAVGERGETALGVLEPEQKGLCLRRKVSRQSLGNAYPVLRGELRQGQALSTGLWTALDQPEAFFTGSLRGSLRGITGALWRQEGALRLLALPFDTRRPFLLTGLFCFARVRDIGGKSYAVFAFDRQERPVFIRKL